MKKLLIAFGLLVVVSPAFAQLTPGRPFLGTHVGGSITRDNTATKTTTVDFSPIAAFAVSSHWMLGIQVTISASKSETDMKSPLPAIPGTGYYAYTTLRRNIKSTTISFGPIARYYTSLSPRFAFFAEGTASYAKTKHEMRSEASQFVSPGAGSPWGTPTLEPIAWNNSSSEHSQGSMLGTLAPGLVLLATPAIGIELKANWFEYTYSDKGNEFSADPSLARTSVGVGFYF